MTNIKYCPNCNVPLSHQEMVDEEEYDLKTLEPNIVHIYSCKSCGFRQEERKVSDACYKEKIKARLDQIK